MADKKKDSLMKMLLSTAPANAQTSFNIPRLSTPTSSVPSPASETGDDNCLMLSSYLNPLGIVGQNEASRPWEKINLEHNYNESLDHSYIRPTKTLFMSKPSLTGSLEDIIDVVTEPVQQPPFYDIQKSHQVMQECEKNLQFLRLQEVESDNWEEMINQIGWTESQSALFNKVVKVLHADRLARLAMTGDKNEPVRRRIFVDKSAQRFREAMASVMWDTRLVQWLHSVLIENLSTSYLAAYLDILQTLKCRIPSLIDKMMAASNQPSKVGSVISEGLNLLLKRPWDPVITSLNHNKLRKLPGNPIFLMVPSSIKKHQNSLRTHLWHTNLSGLGTVITVTSSFAYVGNKLTTHACLAQLITATKSKLAEVRVENPKRPIILVGWRSGAALACQIAVTETLTAVVCLGFSTNTVEGPRGEPDDSILDVQCPVLFVTGENAATARPEDLEDLREKMRVQNGLIVVGGADDCLRMGKSKKSAKGVTQSMVDRCILEQIGDFLAGVLTSPKPILTASDMRKGIYSRRRHNSTTSSVDSESSTAKRSRPGTPQFVSAGMSNPGQKHQNYNNHTSQANGNKPVRTGVRGRRPNAAKKANIVMNPTFQTNVNNQVNNTNGGITVNIGSLASLGPIGPLRMGPNSSSSSSSTTTTAMTTSSPTNSTNFMTVTQPSSSKVPQQQQLQQQQQQQPQPQTQSQSQPQPVSTPSKQKIVEAAPPEEVMPLRGSSEGSQPDSKSSLPQSGGSNQPKGITRLIVTPTSSTISNLLQNTTPKTTTATITRLSLPATASTSSYTSPVSETKKSQTPVRQMIATTSRLNNMNQTNKAGSSIQILEKPQGKVNKILTTNRPAMTPTIINQQKIRPQVRSVPNKSTFIRTSPVAKTTAVTPTANRGQKYTLTQNAAGKYVTSSGANVILLENSNVQNRPIIVPISGSGTKISPQLKTQPKLTKTVSTPPTKTSPLAKFAMSKKIIPTSILHQRPVFVKNKAGGATLTNATTITPSATTSSTPSPKIIRSEASEPKSSGNEADSEYFEIPIYYTEEGMEEQMSVGDQSEEQPVVIPIIDTSKIKAGSNKKSLPKDISITEDGDSISFPLDCEIGTVEEESPVKVLIGSMNRVVKMPQIYVTKTNSNVNKKMKTFVPTKRALDENAQGQVILNERQEAKYFINYGSGDGDEGIIYEIVDNN